MKFRKHELQSPFFKLETQKDSYDKPLQASPGSYIWELTSNSKYTKAKHGHFTGGFLHGCMSFELPPPTRTILPYTPSPLPHPPALPLPLGHPSSPLAPPAPQSPIPNLLPYERPLKNHPGAHFRNFTVSSHSVALTTSGSRLFPFPGGRAPTDISPTVEAEPFPAAVHSCRVVARAVEDAVAIGNDRGPAARECCREKVRPSGREWRWFVKDGVLVLVAQATRVERWPVYLRQLQNPGASGRKGQCSGNFDAVTFLYTCAMAALEFRILLDQFLISPVTLT